VLSERVGVEGTRRRETCTDCLRLYPPRARERKKKKVVDEGGRMVLIK